MKNKSNSNQKSNWKLTENEIEMIVLALEGDIEKASWTHTQEETKIRQDLAERFRAALPKS